MLEQRTARFACTCKGSAILAAQHLAVFVRYGVNVIVRVVQIPLTPWFEHSVAVALRLCPLGSYANLGELCFTALPGAAFGFSTVESQPL